METKLDEAELLLSEGEFDKTYLNLTSAEDLGEDIEALLEDMENANELIINILGSFAPADQTEKAVELRVKLSEDTEWLKTLRAAYEESVPQNIPTGLDDLEVPGQIYPGMPYTISGLITYDSEIPSIERDITLLWDGEPLDSAYSYRAQSTFEIEVTPDENTMLGEHRLTVIIEPQDQYQHRLRDNDSNRYQRLA